MDRRSFILTSIAAIGTLATARIGSAAQIAGSLAEIKAPAYRETLYIENTLSSMLSLGGRATDWHMREWTWRMYYADQWHADTNAELSETSLSEAAYDFGIDAELDPDWREKLEKNLDETHPDSGKLAGQENEFRFYTSPTARAYALVREIIKQLPVDSREATQQELGLWFDESGLGVIAHIGEDKADLLTEIIKTMKLPIEVEEA